MKKRKQISKVKTSKLDGTSKKVEFRTDHLEKALLDVDDLMIRSLLQNVYLTLLDTAKAFKDQIGLYGDGIDIGIEKRYLTHEVMSTFKSPIIMKHRPSQWTDSGFVYYVGEVPVRVKFINRNYGFFRNPDVKFYLAEEYQIPNPFDNYWKTRFLIQ